METTLEWEQTISQIVADPGVSIIIGAVDTGKTHFCTLLANAGVRAGVRTAVVDADVGQSEIGAPGTIGMAIVGAPFETMSELPAKALYFIGATSPMRHLVECVVGTRKMVDAALADGSQLVVVDTTGLIDGEIGRRLKTNKVHLVRPKYLVGIQKKREVDCLLAPFAKSSDIRTIRLSSSELARPKPVEFRAARRQTKFYNHFRDCQGHIIRLDSVSTWNTWLGTGRPMKWQYQKALEDALGCRVLHAEVTGRGIYAVSEQPCTQENLISVQEYFKGVPVSIVAAEVFTNLLVGLADENGNTLDIGLIQAIDFKERFIFVLSPIKTISPVRVIQFGSLRVTKEGKELGSVRHDI
ncbi:MAG: Clp1/GlmU family protein [Armatimonadota bacterium]|nr:Clp1/GlmU family protein [Armatimonadota bacterium]